ncbi:MAG: GTPase HflX [Deltaproteobacteria bacterium]|nr:GTPase HflX [Deltaproteobacteria bacterium]
MVQKAVLIGVNKTPEGREKTVDSLEELALLSETAGATNVSMILKTVKKINPAYYLPKGMLEDIKGSILNDGADLAIIDINLSPAQERNMSEYIGVDVIDRTRLILDIFATHARTAESKYQVELAMLNYILPRLKGIGTMLSRTGAGIGTRGPGETKLETDRRKVRQRIAYIKDKLKLAERTRMLHRSSRKKHGLSTAALVGYTNSGKTTLLYALTGKGEDGENKLFATLGTKMASIYDKFSKRKVIISDTVGFIRNLPPFLMESFKATLEETANSDILIHVIDPLQKSALQKFEEVIKILVSIGAGEKKTVVVLNKIDLLTSVRVRFLKTKLEWLTGDDVIPVSAKTGDNIGMLKEKIFNDVLNIK